LLLLLCNRLHGCFALKLCEEERGERARAAAKLVIMANNRHTIILMQPGNRATRTFMDYDSIASAMDGICGLFEKRLKDSNPNLRNITYDIADLYRYIEALTDMSALVFDPAISAYAPFDRAWIKQQAFQRLKRLAGQ
jgi:hypothetical protein